MPHRRRLAPILLLVLLVMGLAPVVDARPIRTLSLDTDVPEADVIVVARITRSTFQKKGWFQQQFEGRRKPTPDGQGMEVDIHEVKAKVVLPLKGGAKKGSTLTFRHRLESTTAPGRPNGFMSHAFQPGTLYLLVLRKETDGVLAVPAPETWFYVTFPDAMEQALPTIASAKEVQKQVLQLHMGRFDHGASPDDIGVSSAAALGWSKVGKAYLKTPAVKVSVRSRTKDLVEHEVGSDTHRGVIWLRRWVGTPIPAKTIVGWIVDGRRPMHVRSNLVGELRSFDPKTELASLETIRNAITEPDLLSIVARAKPHAQDRLRRQQAYEKATNGR